MGKAKPYSISKQIVWKAYKRVKANRGAAGVDRQSLEMFEKDLKNNLYKIWNRMSSGSYFPPPVRLVEIPKAKGKRQLGIPTVSDRVAQTVAKMYLEPMVEPKFHEDSYGSRPGKSALDAVATARQRCWRRDWVVDLDIKGFFDNLDWNLVMRAVRFHTELKWLHLYTERWLRAPVKKEDGSLVERTKGSPQGSVISPLLANLYMHYAFDEWIRRNYPNIQFERYVDDVVIHCVSEKQAKFILQAVERRLKVCGLELHPEKTQIVYCQDDDRRGKYNRIKFDFLGYTFQPRRAKNRYGKYFVSFLPAISTKSANKIRKTIRSWRIAATRNNQSLEDLAKLTDPYVRGWMNYYGRFYRSKCHQVLRYLNTVLVKWVRRKYKDRYRRKERKAAHWLGRIATRDPNLFVLWKLGIKPAAGR
jgi:RNA-directed DNA polymerase